MAIRWQLTVIHTCSRHPGSFTSMTGWLKQATVRRVSIATRRTNLFGGSPNQRPTGLLLNGDSG
jgi:hypothetical protein